IRLAGANGDAHLVNAGAGALNLGTNNTTRLLINSTGNVGIGTGTTAPNSPLTVVGQNNTQIVSSTNSGTGVALFGNSTGGVGVGGQTASAANAGVYGYNTSSTGPGVWGFSATGTGAYGQSNTGTGVSGFHQATGGTSPGVFGETISTANNANAIVG